MQTYNSSDYIRINNFKSLLNEQQSINVQNINDGKRLDSQIFLYKEEF